MEKGDLEMSRLKQRLNEEKAFFDILVYTKSFRIFANNL